ncbi:hypothetical protein D3C87_1701130 [compost metagenome]
MPCVTVVNKGVQVVQVGILACFGGSGTGRGFEHLPVGREDTRTITEETRIRISSRNSCFRVVRDRVEGIRLKVRRILLIEEVGAGCRSQQDRSAEQKLIEFFVIKFHAECHFE